MSPCVVWTAVIRPLSIPKPVTVTPPWNAAPLRAASRAIASAGRVAFVWMSEGTYSAPRMRSDKRGNRPRASAGPSRWASTPQLKPYPALRFRSVSRAGVQATSRLPTVLAHGAPSSSIADHSCTVYVANAVMVFDGLI